MTPRHNRMMLDHYLTQLTMRVGTLIEGAAVWASPTLLEALQTVHSDVKCVRLYVDETLRDHDEAAHGAPPAPDRA